MEEALVIDADHLQKWGFRITHRIDLDTGDVVNE